MFVTRTFGEKNGKEMLDHCGKYSGGDTKKYISNVQDDIKQAQITQ
jgi:hypothetical protein